MNTCAEVVMLIDDNEIDTFIHRKLLEYNRFSNQLLIHHSGATALDYISVGKDLPDLIFLDLNMPVVDGHRFLGEFSKLPEEIRKKMSIVVLSSSNNSKDREKVEVNPDVLKFLCKPLNESKLEEVKQLLSGEY